MLKSQDGSHRWNRYDREGAANPLLSPASSAFKKLKASLETKVISKITFNYVQHYFLQFDAGFLSATGMVARGFVRNSVLKFRRVRIS